MTHYNTTHLAGNELEAAQVHNKTQEQRILDWYAAAPEWLYTPSELRTYVFNDQVPLTSVRRAMTDLTNQGKLVKSLVMRKGPYNVMEHCWRRKIGAGKQVELAL